MDYEHLIHDFANRTFKNLEYIEKHLDDPEAEVYEVTQLINSMLGLLVFPQQTYVNRIPKYSLSELKEMGWPEVKVTSLIQESADYRPCTDLRMLIRYLRNSISHFNLIFLTDSNTNISGIRVWNIDTFNKKKPKIWEAELDLETLKILTKKFIELIENQAIE